MAEARCVHELLPGQCGPCSGRDGETAERVHRKALLLMRGVVKAHYPGRCAECGEPFATGTPIKARSDDQWVGACCLDDNGMVARG